MVLMKKLKEAMKINPCKCCGQSPTIQNTISASGISYNFHANLSHVSIEEIEEGLQTGNYVRIQSFGFYQTEKELVEAWNALNPNK